MPASTVMITCTIYSSYLYLYLNKADISSISYEYWVENEKNEDSNFANFASFCRDILTIPASEAAVERLFSHLQCVYNHSNIRMHNETINYRLCVKMYNIFKDISKPIQGMKEKDFKSIMECCNNWIQKIK